MSCPMLSNLGGLPREGVHSYRIMDVAVVDVAATAVGAYGISKLTGYSFFSSFIGLFLLGEGLHYMFNVPTKVMEEMGAVAPNN